MITLGFRRAVEQVVRTMTGLPRFVPLQTTLTSTSWDGDTYSATAKTLMDLSTVFGVPPGIKAILAKVAVSDSGSASTTNCMLILGPTNVANSGVEFSSGGLVASAYGRTTAVVPCDANGDVYYQIYASGAGTLIVYISILGYWI